MNEIICMYCGNTVLTMCKPTKFKEVAACVNCKELIKKSDEFFKDVEEFKKESNGKH